MSLEQKILEFCQGYTMSSVELSLMSTVRLDMGLDGDDALDFLHTFSKVFDADLSSIVFEAYFHTEAELRNKKWWQFRSFSPKNIASDLNIEALYLAVR